MMRSEDTVMELISTCTSPLGDFKMPLCIRRIAYFNLAGLFRSDPVALDILLSRYKEHVAFWGINIDLMYSELRQLAYTLGIDENILIAQYNGVAASLWRRYLPQQTHQ